MDFRLIKFGIRFWQLLWILLFTALIGNVIATTENASGSARAAINFSMFVAIVAWIAVLYGLVANFMTSLAIPMIQLPIDGAATIFSLIDAIVLSAKLKTVNCGDLDPKKLPTDYIAWGSPNDEKRCREIQASTVFMWLLVVGFSAGTFFTWREGRGLGGGSIRSSRPSMAQVGV
jgi:hypothetical protein